MNEKKDRLEKFRDGQMSTSEADNYLELLLHDKMSTQQKLIYARELKDKYNVSRKPKGNLRYVGILGLIALILGAVLFFTLFRSPKEDLTIQKFAQNYVEVTSFPYNDQFRGESQATILKNKAYEEYQSASHATAVTLWKDVGIDAMSDKDKLYYGISLLKVGQNEKAYEVLQAAHRVIPSGEEWLKEVEFYYVLACLLTDRITQADEIRNSWPSNSWAAKEYKKVVK